MSVGKAKVFSIKRVVLAVVIVCVVGFFLVLWAIISANNGTTVNNEPADVSNTSSSQPVQTETAKVGDTVSIGGSQGLAVRLVQIIDPAQSDNQSVTPDAGKRFVAVKVQITNNGSSAYKDDANGNLTLIGSDGQSYTFDAVGGSFIAGCTNFSEGMYTLAQGESATGCVGFQVPNGVRAAKVQFTTSSGMSGDSGEWLAQ